MTRPCASAMRAAKAERHRLDLAAAERAVKDAAMAWHAASLSKDPHLFLAACERLNELDAACATLAALEAK